uniref:Uncharacterized protein n=1 Tax=Timema bartmani TaxID=61472 RepID=A0A7R9F1R5_9NEOP|nr:unnamed protein product [Timema bartmani]
MHEMGVHDTPAVIDYILSRALNTELYYIGHSLGASLFFIMTSEKPEYNSKVRAMIGLAPGAFLGNARSPLIVPWFKALAKLQGFGTSMAPSRVDDVIPKPLDKRIGGTGKSVVEGLRQLPEVVLDSRYIQVSVMKLSIRTRLYTLGTNVFGRNFCAHTSDRNMQGRIVPKARRRAPPIPTNPQFLLTLNMNSSIQALKTTNIARLTLDQKRELKSLETKYRQSVQIHNTNNGTEYVKEEFYEFIDSNSIIVERTVPYISKQNSRSEGDMHTVVESVRELIKIPREVMPRSRQMTNIGITLCRDGALTQYVCLHLMSLVGGFNDFSVNTTSLPVNLGHFPNGASQKTVAHIGQTVMSGRFSQFDYGRNINLKKYGRPTSPDYDLEAITAPVALYYGDNDLLITPQDIARLFSVLKNSRDRTMKRFYTYSHFDFLWGVNVKSVVYDYILSVIDTYT